MTMWERRQAVCVPGGKVAVNLMEENGKFMVSGNRTMWTVFLTALAILYILARLRHLTDSCLWFDEIFSVHAAEMDVGDLISFVAKDLIHPPLFYILLKIWIAVGDESLFWLRFFGVLFSIFALIPFFLLCRALQLSFPAAAFALTLFASNGALIRYAQEVRMYSVLLCLSLVSCWLFVEFFKSGRRLFILTFVNILLVYTHYFGWLVLLAQIAAVLIWRRDELKRILFGAGFCVLSYAPWIYQIWRAAQINADVSQNLGWAAKPDLRVIFQFVLDLIEPFYFQASNSDFASNYLISLPILLILLIVSAVYFVDGKKDDDRIIRLLLTFIFAPIIAAFIFSWLLPVSVWGTRHLIVVFVPFLIFIAALIDKIELKLIRILITSALGILILAAFAFETGRENQRFIWCGWEVLAKNLDQNQPQTVYVFEDLVAYHFWFAERGAGKIKIVRVKNVPEMIEDKAYFLPRNFDAVKTIDADEMIGERFYVAFRDMKFDERHPPLNILKEKGYTIGEPQIFDANGLKAYLVEVYK